MTTQQLDQETIAFVKDASAKLQECATRLKSRIKDQDELIDLALASVVSSGEEEVDELFIGGGHMLIMGPPGTGKTRFVKELSTLLNLQMKRIQGTNDLTPADLLGYEVTREHANGDKYLEFIPGPIFTQMLFVDEITRMSPKTQSALLQAMSEGFVTVNG
ncbi:MAG TPA: AAA family ATPase, partial [Alphaproteobacteria bacterium]|nr:AAA family ATPase [Alphaproteobacteria bacterium]